LCRLAAASAPLSHAEIVAELESSGFGAPTIFRCLCDLTEAGLAKRIDLGDHVWRFGFHARHPDDADHPHFLCVDCGAATCLPDIEVPITASQRRQVGDVTEIVLKGHCPNCR
jgi:Fur family ferric uptake transcriptional regulator